MSSFTSASKTVTVTGFTDLDMTAPLFSAVVNLKSDKESYEGTILMGDLTGDLEGTFSLTTNSKGDLVRGTTKGKGDLTFIIADTSLDPNPAPLTLDGELKGKTTGLPDFGTPGAVTSQGKFSVKDGIKISGTYDMTWIGPYVISGTYTAKVKQTSHHDD